MRSGVGVFCSVLIWRTVAAKSCITLLTRAEMNPARSNLHTLFAEAFFGLFDVNNRINMNADTGWHLSPGVVAIA
jgi:hypothetical protein